jgi:hypothetical protein
MTQVMRTLMMLASISGERELAAMEQGKEVLTEAVGSLLLASSRSGCGSWLSYSCAIDELRRNIQFSFSKKSFKHKHFVSHRTIVRYFTTTTEKALKARHFFPTRSDILSCNEGQNQLLN